MTISEENEILDDLQDEAAEAALEKEIVENETEQSKKEEKSEEQAGDKLAEELAHTKDQLLRTMAEYDNFRKRTVKEKEALRAEIITNVTSKFLPVIDNLERALSTECSDENYKKGVQMISDSFLEIFKGLGVEEIESDGAAFDPGLHQAVQRVQKEDAESGTVVQTFAKGYKIGDKVIRFAMVAVAE